MVFVSRIARSSGSMGPLRACGRPRRRSVMSRPKNDSKAFPRTAMSSAERTSALERRVVAQLAALYDEVRGQALLLDQVVAEAHGAVGREGRGRELEEPDEHLLVDRADVGAARAGARGGLLGLGRLGVRRDLAAA